MYKRNNKHHVVCMFKEVGRKVVSSRKEIKKKGGNRTK